MFQAEKQIFTLKKKNVEKVSRPNKPFSVQTQGRNQKNRFLYTNQPGHFPTIGGR